MDDKSLNFNAEKILHTLFTPNVKGYDPDEVDSFLDKVIEDTSRTPRRISSRWKRNCIKSKRIAATNPGTSQKQARG